MINNPYSVLERSCGSEYWKTIEEPYETFAAIWNRIEELWLAHDEEFHDAGFMAVLRNRLGDRLHFGISHNGWLLILRRKFAEHSEGISASSDAVGYTDFLMPIRTPFKNKELVTHEFAEEYIRKFLDQEIQTGQATEIREQTTD